MTKIGDKASSMDQPIDHLLSCHRRMEERLEGLERAAAALDDNREEALAAIRKGLDFLTSTGGWHTQDEEESFFPRLRPVLEPAELRQLDELAMQHNGTEAALDAARTSFAAVETGAGYGAELRERLAQLRVLYGAHIALEEAKLIGLARLRLTPEDLRRISEEMKARRNGVQCKT